MTPESRKQVYRKCDMSVDSSCGLPCHDITDDGYCMLQPINERKQAEEILLEVFEMGMDAQEIGMPSFDMIKQTGRINGMIDSLLSLKLAEEKNAYIALENTLAKTEQALLVARNEIAEATKGMYRFIEWIGTNANMLYYPNSRDKWLLSRIVMSENPSVEYDEYTTAELFEYWKQNIRK